MGLYFWPQHNPDIDTLFNSFLNNYLRIFHNHFPQHKFIKRNNRNYWITSGIKISCKHKRFLYWCARNSDVISLKKYYKQYCKILANVIKKAKNYTYNNQINQQIISKQLGTSLKRKLIDIRDLQPWLITITLLRYCSLPNSPS